MLGQLHMGKSATFVLQRFMQMISNNVANATTPGYKRSDMEIESLFPQVMERVIVEFEDPNIEIGKKRRNYVEFGTAMRIAEVEEVMTQGGLEVTNRELDLAIDGEGYFQFKMPDGTLSYSRAGNLKMNYEGVIVDPNGHPLEPRLEIPKDVVNVVINEEGQVFAKYKDEPENQPIGQLQLAKFSNPSLLRSLGQNLFAVTDEAGKADIGRPGDEKRGRVKQGALELSNVNVIEEMVEMLTIERSFQLMVGSLNSATDIIDAALEVPKS